MVRKQTFCTAKLMLLAGMLFMGISLFAQESLTTAQFKEKVWDFENNKEFVLASDVPVVLDFWASWCGPCRMLAPELTALQKEYNGKIKVYKINVDEEQGLARAFRATALPTIYFIGKDKITYVQGYRTQQELSQIVKTYLLNK